MSKRHNAPIPLYTARAIARLNASEEEGDSRVFFPHRTTLDKKKYRCCRKWNRTTLKWEPTKYACPKGTHDELGCSAVVIQANTAEPWKRAPKYPDNKTNPKITLIIKAKGEVARQIYVAPNNSILLIDGHMSRHYNYGKYWDIFNVTDLKFVSEETVRAHLSHITLSKYRERVLQAGTKPEPLEPFSGQMEDSINHRRLSGLRSRRLEAAASQDDSDADPQEELP